MSRLLLSVVLACATTSPFAQSTLQPVPEPDLSGLGEEQAKEVRRQRAEFDSVRQSLLGAPLAGAYGVLGNVYARHGLLTEAQVAYGNALVLLPDEFDLNYLGAMVAMLADDLESAERLFEQAQRLDSDYPATRIHLGGVLARRGDTDSATRVYREAIDRGHNIATAHARLGQLALEQNRVEPAIEHFEAALAAEPGATGLYRQLATAERRRGREGEAAALEARAGDGRLSLLDPLARAIFAPPTGPMDRVLEQVAAGQLGAARAMLDEYLAGAPEDLAATALMARVEAGLGNLDEARRWVRYALQLGPERAVAHVAAGVVAEIGGDEAGAIERFQRAVDVETGAAEARLMLGDALMRQRKYHEAARHYRALAARDGERAEGLPRLVAAEVMAGRCESALAAANAAREAHPRDGVRAEIWVRVVVTCPAAKEETRQAALDLAEALYNQHPDADSSEAAAMALAAAGKFDDAFDLQRQALFELAKVGDQAAIERSRILLQRFGDQRPAELPWPPGHPLLAPPSLRVEREN